MSKNLEMKPQIITMENLQPTVINPATYSTHNLAVAQQQQQHQHQQREQQQQEQQQQQQSQFSLNSENSINDPLRGYYGPIIVEFLSSLMYTLFSNLLGVIGVADSAAKLSIAIFDGSLNYALISMFGAFGETHFNPVITLTSLLAMNIRPLFGALLLLVQFSGSFFGALLTKATLSPNAFLDSFIALGIVKRNIEISSQEHLLAINLYGSSDSGSNNNNNSNNNNYVIIENLDNIFANRFQIFLIETLLSTFIAVSYMHSSIYKSVLTTASTVGAARSISTLVGLFTLGQNANLARQLANNATCSIFLMDDRVWRYFYISFFATITASVLSAATFWVVRSVSAQSERKHKVT